MSRVTLSTSREHIEAPDLETLFERFVLDCPRYWTVAPGDAGLFFQTDDRRSQLIAIYAPEAAGYFLTFQQQGDDDEYTLERQQAIPGDVEIHIGGEPELVARRHLLSPEVAWEIVQHFAQTGDRGPAPDGARWVRHDRRPI